MRLLLIILGKETFLCFPLDMSQIGSLCSCWEPSYNRKGKAGLRMELTQKEKKLDLEPLGAVVPVLFLCVSQREATLSSLANKRILTDKSCSSLLLLKLV